MTAYPCDRKYSADVAPRVPAEKLSTKRTIWFSRGTVVPPEVTRTTRREEDAWRDMNSRARVECFWRTFGFGLEVK